MIGYRVLLCKWSLESAHANVTDDPLMTKWGVKESKEGWVVGTHRPQWQAKPI